MGIRMVRQPSETPNVTNIDDIIPFRYAYGNQDGYVIGKGTELSYTIDGSTFRVNSGRVVLQGVETDIDANGVSFIIDNASEKRFYSVYYEVNLATQTTAVKLSNYSTTGYVIIDSGDDLTVNSHGVARLELYSFFVNNGTISQVKKVVNPIWYSSAKPIEIISDEYKLLNRLDLTDEFIEVAEVNTGIFLKFTFSSWNEGGVGGSENIGKQGFSDAFTLFINEKLDIVKQLSTCFRSASNIESALGKNIYIHIKYENGKIYMRSFTATSNTTYMSGGASLKGIYQVSGVEYVI